MASFAQTPTGDIVICLAPDELRGLSVLATEGAAALLNDLESALIAFKDDASIDAAKRALDAVRTAAKIAQSV
jgi:hypothetical protein